MVGDWEKSGDISAARLSAAISGHPRTAGGRPLPFGTLMLRISLRSHRPPAAVRSISREWRLGRLVDLDKFAAG